MRLFFWDPSKSVFWHFFQETFLMLIHNILCRLLFGICIIYFSVLGISPRYLTAFPPKGSCRNPPIVLGILHEFLLQIIQQFLLKVLQKFLLGVLLCSLQKSSRSYIWKSYKSSFWKSSWISLWRSFSSSCLESSSTITSRDTAIN